MEVGVSDFSQWCLNVEPCAGVTKTTSIPITTVSVLLVGSNPKRKGMYIWNNSSNSAYISFGATSSSATPTFIVAAFSTLRFDGPAIYTGPVSAVRNSGTGTITTYEIH